MIKNVFLFLSKTKLLRYFYFSCTKFLECETPKRKEKKKVTAKLMR